MKIFLWGIVVIKIKRNKGAANQEKDNNKTFPPFPFLSLLVEPRSGERFAASEASSEAATKQ